MSLRTAEKVAAGCFAASAVCAIALAVVYVRGGNTQAEGALLAGTFGGFAAGFAIWAAKLLPAQPVVEEKNPFERTRVTVEGEELERRSFLLKVLGAAGAVLAGVALLPLRSLGPRPGRTLFETAWRAGSRVVTEDGDPIRVDDLEVGAVVTVFPEGHTDAIRSQTLLIRLEEGRLRRRAGRETWAPQGHVAYSKICTHAACPVGLYKEDTHRLFCPCHQSAFDALDGARPLLGPAARPLPQLPLAIDPGGYLIAQSDFTEPVGPSFWERGDA